MKTRRLISMLLVTAIVLGLLAMAIPVALADTEPQRVGSIEITGVPQLEAGKYPTTDGITVTTSTNSVTLQNASWDIAPTDTVQFGNFYTLRMELKIQDGFYYAWEDAVLINTSVADMVGSDGDESVLIVEEVVAFGLNAAGDVQVTGLPTDLTNMVGKTTQEILNSITVTGEHVQYAVSFEQMNQDGPPSEFNGTFEKGKEYCLNVSIEPEYGYYLHDLRSSLQVPEGYDVSGSERNIQVRAGFDTYDWINQVEVTAPKVYPGATIDLTQIKVPEGADYTLTNVALYQNDLSLTGGVYQEGMSYRLELQLEPKANYKIREEQLTILLNGEDKSQEFGCRIESGKQILEYHFGCWYEDVGEVTIVGAPEAVVGQVQSVDMTQLQLTSAHASITDAAWQVYDPQAMDYVNMQAGESFVNGKDYGLYICVTPEPGYAALGVAPTVNGKDPDDYWTYPGGAMEIMVKYNFTEAITKLSVTGIPEQIQAGQTISTADVKIPAGANYTLEATWRDRIGMPVTGTFEDGKAYMLQIVLLPKEGYRINEDAEVWVDGRYFRDWYGDNTVRFTFDYSLCTPVEKIEITGVPTPTVGGVVSTDTIKIPENANYELTGINWYDSYYNDVNENELFQDGERYELYIELMPKDGFEFADQPQILVDGKDAWDRLDERYDTFMRLRLTYSFKQVVEKVELPALQEAKVGQTPVNGTLSEQDSYVADLWWEVFEGRNGWAYLSDQETFQEGKIYRRCVNVWVKDGYEFREGTTKVLADGSAVEPNYLGYDNIEITTLFPLGAELVDEILLKDVKLPQIGASALLGKVSADEDAGYMIQRASWYVSDQADLFEGDWKEADTFQEGKYYALIVEAAGSLETVFADQVSFVVEGKSLQTTVLENEQNRYVVLAYVMKLEKPAPEPEPTTAPTTEPTTVPTTATTVPATTVPAETTAPTATNPNTAEQSPVMPIILLLMLSAAGLMVTAELKKRGVK